MRRDPDHRHERLRGGGAKAVTTDSVGMADVVDSGQESDHLHRDVEPPASLVYSRYEQRDSSRQLQTARGDFDFATQRVQSIRYQAVEESPFGQVGRPRECDEDRDGARLVDTIHFQLRSPTLCDPT